MSKFKVGDRVRCLSTPEPIFDKNLIPGETYTVARVGETTVYLVESVDWIGWGEQRFELSEPATPTEHPALTLAKAEVVRLTSDNDTQDYLAGKRQAFLEVLRTFGLEYRAKPVVPQPVEYEFVPVDDTRGSAPQESVR